LIMTRRLLRYGETATLVECRTTLEARALDAALRSRADSEIAELVPGANSVLIKWNGPARSRLIDFLEHGRLDPAAVADGPMITVPVRYDGADLDHVAGLVGTDAAGVIEAHTGQTWTVAFCGFAPGFGYLVGEHARLTVPRRAQPRTRVPAGSVALADTYCGIYPRATPGGWQLIGRTDLSVWDLDRDPPALLRPGCRVRFEAIR